MIVTFEKKYLRDLYEKGKSNVKKYRFQPEIVERYIKCINLMRRVDDTQGLAKYNGLNLKKLQGDKADIFSTGKQTISNRIYGKGDRNGNHFNSLQYS